MTTISARIVADSIGESSKRLTTFLLRYPRWIHAEGRTHRQLRIEEDAGDDAYFPEPATPSVMADPNLSRNASSSRAIPVDQLIADVIKDPAIPLFWGANQRGMQAGGECTNPVDIPDFGAGLTSTYSREDAWLEARDHAILVAQGFAEAGYHKQIVNRLLEPFSHINVVVTATEWTNFHALRDHEMAEPHIRLLSQRMQIAASESEPRVLRSGEWHLPFVTPDEIELLGSTEAAIPLSVARCARTSYRTHDGRKPNFGEDMKLARVLLGSVPLHASPAEHQARPDPIVGETPDGWEIRNERNLWGNLKEWVQYRKTLPGECQ